MADLAGQTLADRYDLLELIGSGGMGEVYRARDRELDELVALKVIRGDHVNDAAHVERFRHEVKLARRVTHANVARTFELGHAGDVMFCTMELVDGESLAHRLAAQHRLPAGEAVAIATAVCDALVAAHAAGVIHRDIKPDNILLARDGRVVVADFGVAAIEVDGGGDLSGTPAYMAPEQARGELPTPAADVYAVGAVLYEMLTGRRGFLGEPVAVLDAKQIIEHLRPVDAPAELADLVARATAREPAQRVSSADALRRALAPWARAPHAIATAGAAARPTAALDVHEILVLAPSDGIDPARRYLAEAVHDGILARLERRPRVRVRPRVLVPPDSDATVVALRPGAELRVVVERCGRTLFALDVPLSIDHLDGAAEAAVAAIAATFAFESPPSHTTRSDALDLVLRAQHQIENGLARPSEALPLIARAHALAPDEPMVLAALAIGHVRGAFMADDVDPSVFDRAAELARRSVAAAPELALSHLAMGHLELHLGDPVRAASHFRTALARAPHDAEAHEFLGRLLLEAGYLDLALARLEEALAIAPQRASARWEIARAFALEGRWADYDRLEQELLRGRAGGYLMMARTRVAFWRPGPRAKPPEHVESGAFSLHKATPAMVVSAYSGAPWPPIRDSLVAEALVPHRDRRRNAFVSQIATELSTFRGDLEMASRALAFSVDNGLFDRHWLEKCPLLEPLRAEPAFAAAYAQVKQRAEGVLDALYGDRVVATVAETVLATASTR